MATLTKKAVLAESPSTTPLPYVWRELRIKTYLNIWRTGRGTFRAHTIPKTATWRERHFPSIPSSRRWCHLTHLLVAQPPFNHMPCWWHHQLRHDPCIPFLRSPMGSCASLSSLSSILFSATPLNITLPRTPPRWIFHRGCNHTGYRPSAIKHQLHPPTSPTATTLCWLPNHSEEQYKMEEEGEFQLPTLFKQLSKHWRLRTLKHLVICKVGK